MVDSAEPTEVDYWAKTGCIVGATTNPSVMRRDGSADLVETAERLAALLKHGGVHVQVTESHGDALVSQAELLARIAENIVVKVPVVRADGTPLLQEIRELTAGGVTVNVTACLSAGQALLAAAAGATWISVFAGRLEDEGGSVADVMASIRAGFDGMVTPPKLLIGSIRSVGDVTRAIHSSADAATLPPAILRKLADHRYSRETVAQFNADARDIASGRFMGAGAPR